MFKGEIALIIKEDYKYSNMRIGGKENIMKIVISDYPYIMDRD